jgi:uncharacterized linocin/CFP29 family protein
MKTNPFAPDGLTTAEEMLYIEQKVVETFRFVLAARTIFPVINIGQQGGARTYRYYTESDPSGAQISETGKAEGEDVPFKTANDVLIPVIHKEFFLNWRDIATSRRQGPSLLDDSIRTATRMVAESEDRLLISGEYTGWAALGIEGLFGATGRTNNASAGNWPANAVTDVNVARAALQASGFVGLEPVLIGPPALVKCLDGLIANTGITYRQALLGNGLLSGIIESSNAFAQDGGVDSVVLVIPGQGNFYAVQDLPLMTKLWEDKSGNVYGTIRETITPIIARPASIAEVNTIVCA